MVRRVLIVQGTGEAPATSAVNQGESEGVLEAAGSRIKALLTGGSQPSADASADSSVTPESTLAASEASSEVTLTASAESSVEVSEQVAAGDGSAAVGEADTKADTRLAAPQVEPDPVQNLLALADPDSTTTLEALGAAIIKSVTQPIASIDVLDDSSVAAGVVLLVTPTSTGSAVIIDRQGHVLANWHVVEGYSRVTLLLKEPSGNGVSYQGVYSAEVLKVSRFADLALLKINEPPDDLHVIPLAAHGDLDKGDIVHSVSHPATGPGPTRRQGGAQSRACVVVLRQPDPPPRRDRRCQAARGPRGSAAPRCSTTVSSSSVSARNGRTTRSRSPQFR